MDSWKLFTCNISLKFSISIKDFYYIDGIWGANVEKRDGERE